MERLTNLTKRLVAVPKSEIDAQAKRYDQAKLRRQKRQKRSPT
jgi:hypothetical protein